MSGSVPRNCSSSKSCAQEAAHRRSRSDATGLLHGAPTQVALPMPGHTRSVSLGSSASEFLQSLKLQEPAASCQASAEEQLIQPHQMPQPQLEGNTGILAATHAITAAAGAPTSPAAPAPAPAAAAAAAGYEQDDLAASGPSGRSKRALRGSNGRAGQDVMQLDDFVPDQQQQRCNRLPAVFEDGCLDSEERDWDSDSDRDGLGPTRRGHRGHRRGGYNGRSESELMLLDPKRVKRILANRESAARSKERRMNYTMELEGKLRVLGVESDKLSSQLHSLNKQEGKLRTSKADLEQQVQEVQQHLVAVLSDNQALMTTLFQLQEALGMPKELPELAHSAAMQGTASDPQYQQWWQTQQQQQQQCPDVQVPKSPKQRKGRGRQSKQQAVAWKSSSTLEPDLNDPAAAAAAPVTELPVCKYNLRDTGAGTAVEPTFTMPDQAAAKSSFTPTGHVLATAATTAATTAAAAAEVPVCTAAAEGSQMQPMPRSSSLPSAAAVATAAGTSSQLAPHSNDRPRQQQQQQLWHKGFSHRNSSSALAALPAAPPSLLHSTGHSTALATAAGQAGAASVGPTSPWAISTKGDPNSGSCAEALGVLLGPSGQVAVPGADAVMGDAEDDLAMLTFLFQDNQAPSLGGVASSAAAAAESAAPFAPSAPAAVPVTLAADYDSSAAAAAGSDGGGRNGMAASGACGGFGRNAGWLTSGGVLPKTSPALSEPVAGEMWPDDVSSGSFAGSLTHNTTPNLTPNARVTADGPSGVSPAFSSACDWQQQQQQIPAACGTGESCAAVTPIGVDAGAVEALFGAATCQMSGQAAAAGSVTRVSPVTPVSGRAVAQAGGHLGVIAVTGTHRSVTSGAVHPAGHSYPEHTSHFWEQQQQQQRPTSEMGSDVRRQTGVGRPMEVQKVSSGDSGSFRHIRSASTGGMHGVVWRDWSTAHPCTPHLFGMQMPLQQQQQEGTVEALLQSRQQENMAGNGTGMHHVAAVQSCPAGMSELPGGTCIAAQAGTAAAADVARVDGAAMDHVQAASQVAWQCHRRSHSHAAPGSGGVS